MELLIYCRDVISVQSTNFLFWHKYEFYAPNSDQSIYDMGLEVSFPSYSTPSFVKFLLGGEMLCEVLRMSFVGSYVPTQTV